MIETQAVQSKLPMAPPPSYEPPQKEDFSRKKYLSCVIVAVSAIIATAIVLVIYLVFRPGISQVFHVIIQNETLKIPLEVQIDNKEQIEYFVSPFLGNSTGRIEILRDYKRGVTAHKDPNMELCYVGRLSSISFEERTESLKQSETALNGTENFAVLNDTILPEVLSFTVGDRIVSFCDPYPSVWMVSISAVAQQPQKPRQKRTIGFGVFFGVSGHGYGYNQYGYHHHYHHHYQPWGGYGQRCYPVCFFHCYSRCVSYYK